MDFDFYDIDEVPSEHSEEYEINQALLSELTVLRSSQAQNQVLKLENHGLKRENESQKFKIIDLESKCQAVSSQDIAELKQRIEDLQNSGIGLDVPSERNNTITEENEALKQRIAELEEENSALRHVDTIVPDMTNEVISLKQQIISLEAENAKLRPYSNSEDVINNLRRKLQEAEKTKAQVQAQCTYLTGELTCRSNAQSDQSAFEFPEQVRDDLDSIKNERIPRLENMIIDLRNRNRMLKQTLQSVTKIVVSGDEAEVPCKSALNSKENLVQDNYYSLKIPNDMSFEIPDVIQTEPNEHLRMPVSPLLSPDSGPPTQRNINYIPTLLRAKKRLGRK